MVYGKTIVKKEECSWSNKRTINRVIGRVRETIGTIIEYKNIWNFSLPLFIRYSRYL